MQAKGEIDQVSKPQRIDSILEGKTPKIESLGYGQKM